MQTCAKVNIIITVNNYSRNALYSYMNFSQIISRNKYFCNVFDDSNVFDFNFVCNLELMFRINCAQTNFEAMIS